MKGKLQREHPYKITMLRSAVEQFNRNSTLCHWLRYQSAEVWERVAFSRLTGLVSTFETTITQNLLFEFWQLARSFAYELALFESINERANGNDLEILLRDSNGGYRLLPTQAKILYDNNRYHAIDHGKPIDYQVEKLIAYAKRKKGTPLYLYYNFYPDQTYNDTLEKHLGEPVELLGCSLSDAHKIKDHFFSSGPPAGFHTIPSFADVHPSMAVPWHHLICPTARSLLTQLLEETRNEVMLYSYKEIMTDPDWVNLAPAPRIGYITKDAARRLMTPDDQQFEFVPKYRMVLSPRLSQRIIARQVS